MRADAKARLGRPLPLALAALVVLAGCTPLPPSPEALVGQCQAEVNPGGTYEYDVGTRIPVMRAIEDGTPQGARALNACISNKAAAAGLTPQSAAFGHTGAACPSGAPVLYGGATYCLKSSF